MELDMPFPNQMPTQGSGSIAPPAPAAPPQGPGLNMPDSQPLTDPNQPQADQAQAQAGGQPGQQPQQAPAPGSFTPSPLLSIPLQQSPQTNAILPVHAMFNQPSPPMQQKSGSAFRVASQGLTAQGVTLFEQMSKLANFAARERCGRPVDPIAKGMLVYRLAEKKARADTPVVLKVSKLINLGNDHKKLAMVTSCGLNIRLAPDRNVHANVYPNGDVSRTEQPYTTFKTAAIGPPTTPGGLPQLNVPPAGRPSKPLPGTKLQPVLAKAADYPLSFMNQSASGQQTFTLPPQQGHQVNMVHPVNPGQTAQPAPTAQPGAMPAPIVQAPAVQPPKPVGGMPKIGFDMGSQYSRDLSSMGHTQKAPFSFGDRYSRDNAQQDGLPRSGGAHQVQFPTIAKMAEDAARRAFGQNVPGLYDNQGTFFRAAVKNNWGKTADDQMAALQAAMAAATPAGGATRNLKPPSGNGFIGPGANDSVVNYDSNFNTRHALRDILAQLNKPQVPKPVGAIDHGIWPAIQQAGAAMKKPATGIMSRLFGKSAGPYSPEGGVRDTLGKVWNSAWNIQPKVTPGAASQATNGVADQARAAQARAAEQQAAQQRAATAKATGVYGAGAQARAAQTGQGQPLNQDGAMAPYIGQPTSESFTGTPPTSIPAAPAAEQAGPPDPADPLQGTLKVGPYSFGPKSNIFRPENSSPEKMLQPYYDAKRYGQDSATMMASKDPLANARETQFRGDSAMALPSNGQQAIPRQQGFFGQTFDAIREANTPKQPAAPGAAGAGAGTGSAYDQLPEWQRKSLESDPRNAALLAKYKSNPAAVQSSLAATAANQAASQKAQQARGLQPGAMNVDTSHIRLQPGESYQAFQARKDEARKAGMQAKTPGQPAAPTPAPAPAAAGAGATAGAGAGAQPPASSPRNIAPPEVKAQPEQAPMPTPTTPEQAPMPTPTTPEPAPMPEPVKTPQPPPNPPAAAGAAGSAAKPKPPAITGGGGTPPSTGAGTKAPSGV